MQARLELPGRMLKRRRTEYYRTQYDVSVTEYAWEISRALSAINNEE